MNPFPFLLPPLSQGGGFSPQCADESVPKHCGRIRQCFVAERWGEFFARCPLPASPIQKAWGRSFWFFLLLLFILSLPLRADDSSNAFGSLPDFSLTDQSGKTLGLRDLKGKVWIADFIFTRCQGMCPMLTGRMADLENKLAASDVKLVSFSVDPEFDTPEVLMKYAARWGAEEGKWFFLTGEKTAMRELISAGFRLGVEDAAPEDLAQGAEPVMHSSRFVLVDQAGNIRGLYDSSEPAKMEELMEEALRLLKYETRNR